MNILTVALSVVGFAVLLTAASIGRANAVAVGDVPYCWDATAGAPIGHTAVAGAAEYCVAPEAFRAALAGVNPTLPAGSGSFALDPSSLFKFAFRKTSRDGTNSFHYQDYATCGTMDLPTAPTLYLVCSGSPTVWGLSTGQSSNASYSGAVRASVSGSFNDVVVPFSQPLYDMGAQANVAPVLHATGAKLFAPEGAVYCVAWFGDYRCSLPYSVMAAMGMDAFECVTFRCGVYNESDPTVTLATIEADFQWVFPGGGCEFYFYYSSLPPGRMNDPTFMQFGAAGPNGPDAPNSNAHCGGNPVLTARYRPNAGTAWATIPVVMGTAPTFVTNAAGAVPPPFGAISKTLIGGAAFKTTVADPVSTATGTFTHTETDLVAPGGDAGLRVERWYDSSDTRTSALGLGWTTAWSDTLKTDGDSGYLFADSTGRVTSFRPALGGGWTHPAGVDASLVLRADGSPALLYTNGDVVEFNIAGQIEQRTFADNQSLTIARDTSAPVSTVTSSSGASLTFTYTALASGATRLTAVAGSWGQSVTYTYGTGDRLATATRPGAVSTYTYEQTKGLLTAVTDASAVRQVFNVYNTYRQVISQTAASGAVTTFAYNASALSTTVHDPVTNTDLTYTHDASGRVVAITDPYGKVVTRSWDAQSNALGAVNRNGTSVANTFDGNNNLLTSTDPKTGTTTYTYDTSNRVKTVLDPAGNTTTYGYTGADRVPSSVTDPLGNVSSQVITGGLVMSTTDADAVTTSYTYTGRQVATVTDGLGNVTTYTYDTVGRRTKTALPLGKFSTTAYDTANRVTSQTDFDGGVTTYTYDPAGRVASVTDPTLAVTSNTYDTAGRLATSTAANGAVSTFTYDGDDQLVSTALPGGATTAKTYGPLGRVLTETDEVGRVTTYDYDAAGNQTKVTAPDGGVTITAYDSQGRVSGQTDPANRVSTTSFDTAGRVATQVAPGALTTSYTYDVLGRRKTVTDPRSGVTTIAYTPGGRLKSTTSPANLVTSYTYDLAGRLKTQVEPPNLTTTIGYDLDSNKTSVTDPAGLVTTFTYDAARRVTTVTDPALVVTTNTWSLRGELLTTKIGAQNPAVYVYNPDRTLKTATDPNGYATSFGYDTRGRRTSRTGPNGGIDAWTYDNSGQLLTATDAANRQTTYTYDTAGRVATVLDPSGRKTTTAYNLDGTVKTVAVLNGTTYTYGYDTAGRVSTVTDTSAQVWTYGYEPGGQLAKYTTPAGRVTGWTYDSAGRRTQLAYPDGGTYAYTYDTASRVASITPGEVVADTFTGTTNSAPDTSKWTATLTSGGTAKIVGNELELGYTTTAGSTSSVAATGVSLTDSDVKVRYRFTNTTAANAGLVRVYARQVTGTTGGNYRVEINSSTATATLFRTKGTVTTSLGTFTVPVGTAAQLVRFQVKGSLVSARVWADGTTEPTAWSKSVTDTQVTAAGSTRLEVTRSAGTSKVYLDNVTIVNPTTPPVAVATYGYNADSQVTGETLTGGTRTRTFTTGRLTAFDETLPGLTRATALTYDTTGRIATEATGGVTTTYGYDPAGQLLSTTPSTGAATVYTYDKLGRRATTKIGAAAAVTNTYDATGALLTAGPITYTYDPAGRRLTETAAGNALTYTYNPAGQLNTLKRVQGTVTTTQTRTYDAAGMLATVANVTGSATTLDWDPTGGVAHLLGMTVAGTTDIVQGVAGLVGSKVGATSAAYGLDQNGSVITGAQARSTGYSEFGDATTMSTFEPRLGYRGELTFDSLIYLRARDYQAGTGGFTSADPILGRAGTTTLNNRYHYVDNKPLQRIDPTGLFSTAVMVDLLPAASPVAGGIDAFTAAEVDATFWELVAGLGPTEVAATGTGLGAAGTVGVAVAGGVALGYGIYKLNPGGYADKIENSCANGGAWCPSNALPPPAKGIFEWAAKQTLDWSFLDDDPAPADAPSPQTAGAGKGKSGSKPPCTTNDLGAIFASLAKGNQSDVRTVDTDVELGVLFDVFSAGGTPISRPSYNGQWYQLADGCQVGLRNASKTGGRTIDVRSPDGRTWRVHIV